MPSLKKQIDAKNTQLANEVEKKLTKTTLLLEAPKSEYQNIKDAYGWNKDLRKAENKLGQLIEAKNWIAEHGKSVIIQDVFDRILINNNYEIIELSKYKGEITDALLSLINDYFTKKGEKVGAGGELLIAKPVIGAKYKENAKRSTEVILLEQISEHRNNDQPAYRILGRIGNGNFIYNKLKACLFTHTRVGNAFYNAAVFLAGYLLLWIISKGIWATMGDNVTVDHSIISFFTFGEYGFRIIFYIMFAILFTKFYWWGIAGDVRKKEWLSFNVFDDEKYSNWTNYISEDGLTWKTSTPKKAQGLYNKNTLKLVKLYNRIGKVLVLVGVFLVFYLTFILPISLSLYIKDVSFINNNGPNRIEYKTDNPFTYKRIITENK